MKVLALLLLLSSCGTAIPTPAPSPPTPAPSPPMVTLAWVASPDARVTGYNVYEASASGQETIGSGYVWQGPGTTCSVPVNSTPAYFVVTAIDGQGHESPPSNEVEYTGQSTALTVK